MSPPSDLTARLGLGSDARVIILNADDFGMCHAANEAITDLLAAGHLDSSTIMLPCAWAPEALAFAAAHPEMSVGVHLVLTSEWSRYRWRPLTGGGTSLVDRAGFFPADVRAVEENAAIGDVSAELAAQLGAALAAGVDVTHLDNHMGSVYGLHTGRDLLEPVFALAARHGLPFRLPRIVDGLQLGEAMQPALDRATAAADAAGIVILDRLWTHPFELAGEGTDREETYEQIREGFLGLLRAVPAGVTEIYLHPMVDGHELRAAVDYGAAKRGYERRLLADPLVHETIEKEGLIRISWRALREVQRRQEPQR
ncbi:carbohydrate deacetylase [Microbacterium shaanxiense]